MEDRKPLYDTGDKVKIVNYGHLYWQFKHSYREQSLIMKNLKNEQECRFFDVVPTKIKEGDSHPKNIIFEEEDKWWCDISPEKVGREDVIEKVEIVQNIPKYSLVKNGAWYTEQQLELLNKTI